MPSQSSNNKSILPELTPIAGLDIDQLKRELDAIRDKLQPVLNAMARDRRRALSKAAYIYLL